MSAYEPERKSGHKNGGQKTIPPALKRKVKEGAAYCALVFLIFHCVVLIFCYT